MAVAWFGGALVSLAGVLTALALGPSPWSLWSLVRAATAGDATARVVLGDVRLPRAVGAWLVGAALALAGALLQTATANPIADPYLVGTSAGATLAAVLAVPVALAVGDAAGWAVGPWLPWLQPIAAFAGSVTAVTIAFRLARRGAAERILVAGLVITAFAGAATSFVLTRLTDQRLRAATHWLMGGVGMPDVWAAIPAAIVVAAALGWSLHRLPQLEALALGDGVARGLGIDAQRLGRAAVWWASALSAVAVSIAGIVGFVGLLVPNALRLGFGRDQRVLLPASVFFGGGLVAALDGLSRSVIAPAELPLGVLTALAGCPLLYLLLRQAVREPSLPHVHSQTRPEGPIGIRASDLTAAYAANLALDGIHFNIDGPTFVAVLGDNGSGKSTLLRLLTGLQLPTRGSVTLCGTAPLHSLSSGHAAWLPQTPVIAPGLPVRDVVALGRHAQLAGNWLWRVGGTLAAADGVAVEQALAALDLTNRAGEDIGDVSGGERQRALVAMVLAMDPTVLVLDEPTASMDFANSNRVFALLRQLGVHRGRLVIAATHDVGMAHQFATHVIVLRQGRLLAVGAPGDLTVRAALGPAIPQPAEIAAT